MLAEASHNGPCDISPIIGPVTGPVALPRYTSHLLCAKQEQGSKTCNGASAGGNHGPIKIMLCCGLKLVSHITVSEEFG